MTRFSRLALTYRPSRLESGEAGTRDRGWRDLKQINEEERRAIFTTDVVD
jgi:hypothetical protein